MLKNALIKFLRIFWLFWGCGGIFSLRNSSLGILEFPSLVSSPDLTFFVIPRLDRGISSQTI